ncbi:hypothetical protein IH781_03915 [Patescibacteria group bacterium]|nr:hypothetical protein [Patescibacteria group bacterium]
MKNLGKQIAQKPFVNITYDVPILPLLAILAGTGLSQIPKYAKLRYQSAVFVLLLGVVMVIGYVPQRALLSPEGKHEESPVSIRRVARYIQDNTSQDDLIFTPETYLAVEAERRVVPGTELGRFFYFPEWSPDVVRIMGVLNEPMFNDIITSRQAQIIVINTAFFWRQVPDQAEEREKLLSWIESSGYQRVDLLHDFLPAVESLIVYEKTK